nr:hypothetical protein [Pantoea cypripedii]
MLKVKLSPEEALAAWTFLSSELDAAGDDISVETMVALDRLVVALRKLANQEPTK